MQGADAFCPDGYEIIGRIGAGGMGEVWLALRRSGAGIEKLVVLKRLLPVYAKQPDLLEMFLGEARISARLTHPGIAQVFDFVPGPGSAYLVMEFVHGIALHRVHRRLRARREDLSPAAVARIGAAVAAALHHAHELRDLDGAPLRVVHRDVSPQNVLCSFDGTVKVVDFGIAKAATSSYQTAPGVLKGKLAYMSPEQSRGAALDGRSDLFSLGVVLYELLTGTTPFDRPNEREVLQALDACAVMPVLARRPDVPAELAAVVERALSKQPADRFESGRAMQRALEQVTPPASTDLGALVTELFPENADLPAWVRVLRAQGEERRSASPDTDPTVLGKSPPAKASPPPPSRRGLYLKAAAGVVLTAAAVGALLLLRP